MKNVLFAITIFLVLAPDSFAICRPRMVNIITDIDWKCMFPITIGGASISSISDISKFAEEVDKAKSAGAGSAVCLCPMPAPLLERVGLKFSMNNVFRMVDTVKDAGCFQSLGFSLGGLGSFGIAGQDTRGKKTTKVTTTFTHLITFAPTQLIGLMVDSMCVETSEDPIDVIGMSEFEPWSRDDELSLIMVPEAVLFSNPVLQLYCMVDSVLTIVEFTDPIGYWCVGGHSVFPLSNNTEEVEYVDAASINVAKYIFRLTRTFQILTCMGEATLCACGPVPIWNKFEWRLQLAQPYPDITCRRLGKPSVIWNTPNKNSFSAPSEDNLVFLIWRRRDCCAG